ncbi:MAG: sulfatase [Planctomycetota bacterium]
MRAALPRPTRWGGCRARRRLGTLLLLLAGCAPEAPAPPPDLDVVLIVVDTLRADHVGAFGHARPTSPAIDALAARGVRCERARAQSSWTGPSMVSLMLSRHVAADFVRMPDQPTLAERLRAAGYRTAAFQDNILLAPGTGFDRGFDVYEVEAGPAKILPVLDSDDPRPLFAYFHFVDPHTPYAPLPAYDRFAAPALPADQREAFARHLRTEQPALSEPEIKAAIDLAWARMGTDIARYEGDVLQGDQRVAYVLNTLKASGRLARTLVVLTADHGECLWQHAEARAALAPASGAELVTAFKQGHNSLVYDELIRVPLVLAGAGLPAGVVLDELVENVDIVPTILAAAGLPLPPDLDGRNLLPAIQSAVAGQSVVLRELAFSNTSLFTAVTSRAGLKLIAPWDPQGPDPAQLFDLNIDPREMRPLSADDPRAGPLWEALKRFRADGLRPAPGEDTIDETVRARLEQLGYLGR